MWELFLLSSDMKCIRRPIFHFVAFLCADKKANPHHLIPGGITFPLSTFRSLVLLFVRRRLSRGCMSILFNFTQRAGCDKSTCSPPPRPRISINYKTGAQLHAALSLSHSTHKRVHACEHGKNTLFVCVVRRISASSCHQPLHSETSLGFVNIPAAYLLDARITQVHFSNRPNPPPAEDKRFQELNHSMYFFFRAKG